MDRVLVGIAALVGAIVVALSQLYPEDWITLGILVALVGLVVFLWLLARRAAVDFKEGMNESKRN